MGLDMYLRKYPKVFRDGKKINIAELDPDELAENNKELYEFLKPYEKDAGSDYFKYTSYGVEVGYWRKANAIHNWFVEKVQNGVDECQVSLVVREQLKALLVVCREVRKSCELVSGMVCNGHRYSQNGIETIYGDGKIVENSTVADRLLPTQSGFFFGGTDYDQYYVDKLDETIRIVQKVLDETDFEKDEIYYHASW